MLRGVDLPPWVVATARGFVEAVVMGALATAGIYVTGDEHMIAIAPVGLFIIRWLEGIADQIDPAKNRKPSP